MQSDPIIIPKGILTDSRAREPSLSKNALTLLIVGRDIGLRSRGSKVKGPKRRTIAEIKNEITLFIFGRDIGLR